MRVLCRGPRRSPRLSTVILVRPQVPMYSSFIKEVFERCLDLYLCPRCVFVCSVVGGGGGVNWRPAECSRRTVVLLVA